MSIAMIRSLRIAVADDEADMREFYESMLMRLGHHVVVTAASGNELVQGCREAHPDLVITDIRMPGGDGIDAAERICYAEPVPIILVTAYQDSEILDRIQSEYFMAYLIKPIEQSDLAPAIALAMRRFEQFRELRKEAANLRQALQDRKMIERAKGILMKVAGIDEQEAYMRLRKTANDKNRKLVDVAEMIVTADEAARP